MPIEFTCPQCGQRLRVPDSAAGNQARCPECQTISVIPTLAADPGEATGEPQQGHAGGAPNPYAAPVTSTVSAEPDPLARGQVEIGDSLALTWQLLKANWLACLLATLLFLALFLVRRVVAGLLLASLEHLSLQILSFVLAQVIGVIIQGVTSAILVVFGVNIVHGRDPWNRLYPGTHAVVRVTLVNLARSAVILVTFGAAGAIIGYAEIRGNGGRATVGMGLAALILFLLGINIMFRLLIAEFFVVDRRQGVLEALASSNRHMRGNKFSAFATMFAFSMLAMFGILLTLSVGSLFVGGAYAILMAVIYGMATNRTPAQADPEPTDTALAPAASDA